MGMQAFNQLLFDFIDHSPTPFHAVASVRARLLQAGFIALQEDELWQLQAGHSYFVTRNDSSLIAFHYAHAQCVENGFRFLGAHSDSPCLKVKPNAEIRIKNYLKLGVEVYGGVLLNPWFDRDLSLAGRVVYEDSQARQQSCLIDFKRAIAIIPSLAIHLDREANQNRSVNAQKDILPLLAQISGDTQNFEDILLSQIREQHAGLDVDKILDFELSFYDTQKAAYVGLNHDFFASARLDNLISCHVGLQALIDSGAQQNAVLVINDHEEVGSQTAQGAQGTFLSSVLERICANQENMARSLARSMFISADNAHAIHPNFPDKHDANHGPLLNDGVVIKINANQRYATNSVTSGRFKQLANEAGCKTQSFVVRSDMGCGSTIGPLTAAGLGVQTVDVGVPTFAMHSIRETAGAKDSYDLYLIARLFFQAETAF